MFKILKTFQTHTFPKNARQFVHYGNTGEHHFLGKLNYIGNSGVYWTHPQSSFITRVTDDYEQCVKGNRSDDNNTCWWYFPKKIRTAMENDYSEQDTRDIDREIRNWDSLRNVPEKYVNWYAITGARFFSWFSQLSAEQKVFGAKQYFCTFHTDDAIEKLMSNRQFNSAADELINNLRLVYNRKRSQVTDMRKFIGQDNIPDSYIVNAIDAIDIQNEITELAQRLLKPRIFDLFMLGCHHYLSGVVVEKGLFQQHYPLKTIIGEQEAKFARHGAAGFKWIMDTAMTDEATSIHLNLENPTVDLATSIVILENDTVGCFRDTLVDFSPNTRFVSNSTGPSDLDAARMLANRANEMKKVLVYVWKNAPSENAKHYEYLAKHVGCVTDYSFVVGLRNANYRYGWIPQLD